MFLLLFLLGGGGPMRGLELVTSGPMRCLNKNCTWWRRHTDIHPNMTPIWLNRPSGADSVKIYLMAQTNRHLDMATLWLNRPNGADSVKIHILFRSEKGLAKSTKSLNSQELYQAMPSSIFLTWKCLMFYQCPSHVIPTQGTIKESKESNSIASCSLEDSFRSHLNSVYYGA